MTNAVLLSAGQGRRLSPLTDDTPKCLISVAGRPVLEWQVRALAACGIRDVTVVTGFGHDKVMAAIKILGLPIQPQCLFNPFYNVADNIGSCWAARDLFGEDTLLINGDTLFDPRILGRVLEQASGPINVTIDHGRSYDSDDMKVRLDGERLLRIGKTLQAPISGESIGMLRFRKRGGARFVEKLGELLRDPAALRLWYLSIIDQLADEGIVSAVSIHGLPWAEIDFPRDLSIAAEKIHAFDWSTSQTGAADKSFALRNASLGGPA